MKTWVKWALGIGATAAVVAGAQTATKLRNAAGKVKAYFTNWRVVKIDKGFVSMQFDYRVINNSDFSVTINNLYVTVQVKQGGTFKDVMVSGKINNTISLPARNQKDVKGIALQFNVQNVPELISLLSFTGEGKVITTFSYAGFELSDEQPINTGDLMRSIAANASPILSKIGIQF